MNQQELYQKAMQNIVLPETLYCKIESEINAKQHSPLHKQRYLHRSFKFVPVLACFTICLLLFTNPNAIHAIESVITAGITYFQKDISGLEDVTKVWFRFSTWDRNTAHTAGDIGRWKETYPEFYDLLEENELTDALLPYYYMEDYTYSAGPGYIGELKDGEAVVDAIFQKDNSSYFISICKFKDNIAKSFTHRIDTHYEKTVKGISYEIITLSSDYTYEEYCSITESENIPYIQTEEDFEEWSKRPVYISTMLNGISYTFTLSEDIDIEEFLLSIS